MTDEMVRVLILAVKHGWISEERYEELLDDYVLVPKEPTEAMMNDAVKIQKVQAVIDMAEEWCEDQTNELTDSQVCMSALKDIRRILNTTIVKDPDWESVKEKN